MAGYYPDYIHIQELQEENENLKKEMRRASAIHQDTVAKLKELLALALERANMTQEELEKALEEEDEAIFEQSAWAMCRGVRGCQ